MITPKDRNLVDFLVAATDQGKLRWEATADKYRFTVALRGEYSADIVFNPDGDDYLELRNAEGDVILNVTESEHSKIGALFQLARRNAYDVDNAIDEIMGLTTPVENHEAPKQKDKNKVPGSGPITDEDIPF